MAKEKRRQHLAAEGVTNLARQARAKVGVPIHREYERNDKVWCAQGGRSCAQRKTILLLQLTRHEKHYTSGLRANDLFPTPQPVLHPCSKLTSLPPLEGDGE